MTTIRRIVPIFDLCLTAVAFTHFPVLYRGVGSLAVQIAKTMGAGLVVASAGSEEKRAFARSLGADKTVDYDLPGWPKEVLEATGGRGVDIILESIGGEIFEQNFECLATFGRYIIFGSTRGPGEPFEPRRLMSRCQSMTGIYLPVFNAKPELIRQGMEYLVDQAIHGKLRAQVSAICLSAKPPKLIACWRRGKLSVRLCRPPNLRLQLIVI